jgi:hypothetical protein
MPRPLACLPLFALLLVASPARAQSVTVETALASRLPDVTLEEVPFDGVAEWLAEQTGLTINVRWDRLESYGIPRDKPVSLKARNLPLSQILWLLMSAVGGGDVRLAYRGSGSLLVLSTEDDLGREMLTRVYDVRDLLDRAPRFTNATEIDPATALSQGGNGGSAGMTRKAGTEDVPAELADPSGDELVQLIADTIEPDSWGNAGGRGRIVFWHGQIVVYNTIFVHQRLGGAVIED